MKAIEVQRQPDPGRAQAGRSARCGTGSVQRERNQPAHVLQVAGQVRRDGRLVDGANACL
jgi:hypothetical protein